MRWIFLATFFVWAGTLTAQDRQIENVIGAQIDAFQQNDLVTAFEFASPNIKRIFQTPDTFGRMVQESYPMVWRPDEVRFLEQREIAGQWWQKVLVRDPTGVMHVLDYQMIMFGEDWRINAVQLLPAPEVGA